MEDPEMERDRVIIVQTDLDILHNLAVAIDVTDSNIMIAIRPLAGLPHAFQLNNGRQLGK